MLTVPPQLPPATGKSAITMVFFTCYDNDLSTSVQVLAALGGNGRCLETLDSWVRWAETDRQTTILRALLAVLLRLPVTLPQLKASPLPKSVARLQKYRCAPRLIFHFPSVISVIWALDMPQQHLIHATAVLKVVELHGLGKVNNINGPTFGIQN